MALARLAENQRAKKVSPSMTTVLFPFFFPLFLSSGYPQNSSRLGGKRIHCLLGFFFSSLCVIHEKEGPLPLCVIVNYMKGSWIIIRTIGILLIPWQPSHIKLLGSFVVCLWLSKETVLSLDFINNLMTKSHWTSIWSCSLHGISDIHSLVSVVCRNKLWV